LTQEEVHVQARTVIGSDGPRSAMRSAMIEKGISHFTEESLAYGYKELGIPPGPTGRHQMEKNALHIWPRTTFMMIAMPNMDGSFTCTLFYPNEF
jgi:kynurenine 3-monooxygenase